jgi:hypothetical protein
VLRSPLWVHQPLVRGAAGAARDRSIRTKPRAAGMRPSHFGYGPDGKTWRRQKVSGRTRAEVAAKLRALHAEHDAGAQPVPGYTVHQMVSDWLAEGLDGRSEETVKRPSTAGHTATPAPTHSPQPLQRLQHHRRRQHLRRQARPPIRRGIHVGEHPRREQRLTVLGKEREHAPGRNQLPTCLPHIQPSRPPGPLTLHAYNTARQHPPQARGLTRSSARF